MCLQTRINDNLKSIADKMDILETMIQGATLTLKDVQSIENISGMYREKIVDLVAAISSNLIKLELDIACIQLKKHSDKRLKAAIVLSETAIDVYNKTIVIKEKVQKELKVDTEEVYTSISYLEEYILRVMDNSYNLLVSSISSLDKCIIMKHEGIKNLRISDPEYLYNVYSYGASINDSIKNLKEDDNEYRAKELVLSYMAKNFKNLFDKTVKEFSGRVEVFEEETNKINELKNNMKYLKELAV